RPKRIKENETIRISWQSANQVTQFLLNGTIAIRYRFPQVLAEMRKRHLSTAIVHSMDEFMDKHRRGIEILLVNTPSVCIEPDFLLFWIAKIGEPLFTR